jgi:hypothetical protein
MKKLLFQFGILCLLMPLLAPTCRSDEFDPSKGLFINFDLNAETVNANPTKAGEVFSKTYSFDLAKEFKSRYNIDPSDLEEFYVNTCVATFNQSNCLKLKSYSLVANFPEIGSKTSSNDCSTATIMSITPSNSDAFSKAATTTNFAPAIKAGKAITVTFNMEAKADIVGGFGAGVVLSTRAIYKPK